jgi:hypothetical protein
VGADDPGENLDVQDDEQDPDDQEKADVGIIRRHGASSPRTQDER